MPPPARAKPKSAQAKSTRARVDDVVRIAVGRATLGDVWDRVADAYGARTALSLEEPLRLRRFFAPELTYEEFAQLVARLAGVLAYGGVRRGDRVAVCTANRIDYAATCFAAVRCGAIAVPLHHHLKADEVAALATRSRAKFLVADPSAAIDKKGLRVLTAGAGGDVDRALATADPLPAQKVAPDDPALILFTSGTTGAPKGATITSRSLLAVARLAALAPDARNQSGVCGLPLAHVMGMSTLVLAMLAGTPMHWLTKFDPKVALDRIVQRGATFFVGVPAMYAMLAAEDLSKWDLGCIRLWASGADAMPPPLVEKFRKLGCAFTTPLGRPLLTAAFAEIYGMVELSGPAILKFTPPQPYEDGPIAGPVQRALTRTRVRLASFAPRLTQARATARRALVGERKDEAGGAFGIPIPPYRARVVDDAGRPVKAGVVGELVLKGPGVTKGYDADPQATATASMDGWLRTGDLAWKNRFGLIAFATRKKDVVKHGGYSVFPAEVEAQLMEHPQIAEAVVVGLPHPTKGAVPAAAIVLKRGARVDEVELLAWSREHIAPYKAPRSIAIVSSADVPRNANKKVLKDDLRAALTNAGAWVSSTSSS